MTTNLHTVYKADHTGRGIAKGSHPTLEAALEVARLCKAGSPHSRLAGNTWYVASKQPDHRFKIQYV